MKELKQKKKKRKKKKKRERQVAPSVDNCRDRKNQAFARVHW